jgi:hypothetical protein
MALMRTSRNGEDPKKKKSTWEDVAKNEEIKASNKAAQDKYKSESDVYEKQVKAYASQPKNRDLKSHFQGGGRYLSPSELDVWNKDMEASGLAKERGGLKANKVYVTKDFGKEGSVSSLKTATGKSYSGGMGSFHEWLDKPTKKPSPTPPISEIEIKKTDLSVGNLPTRKPGKIAAKTTGPLRMSERSEEETPFVKPARTLVGPLVKSFYTQDGGVKKENKPIARAVENVKRKVQYAKEGKQFKAYYGAPSSISASDRAGMTADQLGKERASLMGVKRELKSDIKKPGGIISRSEIRSELKNVKKDIRSIGKAQKYAAGNIEARSVQENGKEKIIMVSKKNGSAKSFKPELGERYTAYSKKKNK